MNEKPTPFEMLGPVDTGPEMKWKHYLYRDNPSMLALCGTTCTSRGPYNSMPGRPCPDCERVWERIRRERGL